MTTQAISIARIIEELAYQKETFKQSIGSFRSTEDLLDSAELLEDSHPGLFGFLAFHAKHDVAVRAYLEGQSICDDAGKKIMVLILSSSPCSFAENLTGAMLVGDVMVNYPSHPAYELVERMFPDGERPILPGLLLFDSLSRVSTALYVPLSQAETAAAVGEICRKVFVFADQAFILGDARGWADRLAARLTSERISHRRNSNIGAREWLAIALKQSTAVGTTIVALFPRFVSKLLGL